jgi:hypothetical protein
VAATADLAEQVRSRLVSAAVAGDSGMVTITRGASLLRSPSMRVDGEWLVADAARSCSGPATLLELAVPFGRT